MALVAQGNPEAREYLAFRLCERVRRIQRGLLGNVQDADDAAQETLIEILRGAASFRGDSSLERWADRIAVRTGLRVRQRQRRYPRDNDVEPDDLATGTHESTLDDALPRPLLEYLDVLPPKERQALFLRHGLEYSAQEIAQTMGVALSTTKYRLVAALRRVRKSIRRDIGLGLKGGNRDAS